MHWKTRELASVCEVFTDGDWIESKDQSDAGVRLIQTGNVGEGVFKDRSEKARFVSSETFTRLRCTEIVPGDCLISRLPDPVGRACIVPDTGESMITAVDCTIVRFQKDTYLPELFTYYSQADSYLRAVEAETTGTTRNRISRARLGQVAVPVPPLPEQRRIVAILDKAFECIATAKVNAEKNLQNTRDLIGTGYGALVESFDQSQWGNAPVTNIAAAGKGSMRTGPFGSQLLHSEFVDDGIAVLGIDNAVANEFRWDKRRYITEEKYRDMTRYRVHPGDVLITIMGTCGRCAVVPDGIPVAINTKHLCCITVDRKKCLPDYLHRYFLYDPQARAYLTAQAKGSIMAGLNMGIISALPVRLPPLDQQASIVERFDALQSECDRLANAQARKLAALNELKRSLLHQAFSGGLS